MDVKRFGRAGILLYFGLVGACLGCLLIQKTEESSLRRQRLSLIEKEVIALNLRQNAIAQALRLVDEREPGVEAETGESEQGS